MKKVLLLVTLFLLSACTLFSSSPTAIVEDLMTKYQEVDVKLIENTNDIIADIELTEAQEEKYTNIISKQFENIVYTINSETINEETAVVDIDIEVYDLSTALEESAIYLKTEPDALFDSDNNLVESDYVDYKLKLMNEVTERVTYNIKFNLTKENKRWKLDSYSDEQVKKIYGIY